MAAEEVPSRHVTHVLGLYRSEIAGSWGPLAGIEPSAAFPSVWFGLDFLLPCVCAVGEGRDPSHLFVEIPLFDEFRKQVIVTLQEDDQLT